MKVRIFDRIVTAFVALLLIAVTLFFVGVAWNIIKQPVIDEYVNAIYNININAWIMTGIACVVLIIAIALLFITFGRNKKGGRYLEINNAENGSIRIADSTFKDMINKNAKMVDGVIGSKTSIKSIDKTVQIFIKAELSDDVVIPQIGTRIQETVKTNIEAMCGIKLDKINVVVDNKKKE
ncbi:MAG: alkaline shock response membrane anchor protein AmaP [Clostridiales bacterium]|nr:alkaline shock response membrane anchor protein AmaP [Clostridiales bacterium]